MTPTPKSALDEAREALARVDAACAEYGWTADDGMSSEHLRTALAEVDRLTAENARLREALANLRDAAQAAVDDGIGNGHAFAIGHDEVLALRESATAARRILAEVSRGQ